MLHPFCVLLAVLLLSAGALDAQSVDTIRANPNAVTLRKLWQVGGTTADERVGAGYGPLGDIFHTGTSAWAVYSNGLRECAIYVYDTATRTVQRRQTLHDYGAVSSNPLRPPVVGNFFGNDSLIVMIQHRQDKFHFFNIRDSLLDTVPQFILAGVLMEPPIEFQVGGQTAADLDGDGADELILVMGIAGHPYSELWIYRGGPAFSVDTPAVIVELNSGSAYPLLITDANGDHKPDIIVLGAKIAVYLVDSTLWSWSSDHAADAVKSFPGSPSSIGLADCDGDSVADLCSAIGPDRIALFRSRTGKSWLTRSFDSTDIDNLYTRPNFAAPLTIGPISDSSRRYGTMMFVSGGSHLIFSGGVNGPDAQWDAVGGGSLWTLPALDCDGDGWSDYITGDGFGGPGFCAIYCGGPEIPRDPTVGVRWVPVTGERHTQAVAVWPNPARDLVHIAWRGDLRRFPRQFRIHDAGGSLVASGSVDAGAAEAIWDCSARPDGRYILTLFDANGAVLAATPILIQQ